MAQQVGSADLAAFKRTLDAWTQDDALRIAVVERAADQFGFNVTRCRDAELYRALGIPKLGALLRC
ncbi:MAG: L-2-amino-thiazoline-4-carboxylic acid hydrolase [Blastochloris sp.]|nr:L-2-amino-thiazoline-4-carboxylic acid hydrolase [Blastochloris sp.]